MRGKLLRQSSGHQWRNRARRIHGVYCVPSWYYFHRRHDGVVGVHRRFSDRRFSDRRFSDRRFSDRG